MRRIECLIADDSALFVAGLERELERAGRDFRVVGIAFDPTTTLEHARARAPDVVLLGFDPTVSTRLAKVLTGRRLLMLTWSRRQNDMLDALCAGVDGFLHKDVDPVTLVAAIVTVAGGGRTYPAGWEEAMIARLVGASPDGRRTDWVDLTAREREVVRLVAEGCSNKEVAHRLGVAYQTAKNHVHHVMAKVGVSSRVQLSRWALQRGYGPVNRAADRLVMADA